MDKRIIILFIALLPLVANARWGYKFSNYTLFYGGFVTNNTRVVSSFELLFDQAYKSCMVRPTYYGLGLIGTFSPNFNEYGIKGIIFPFHRTFGFGADTRIFPYFFGQGNMYQSNSSSSYNTSFNFRPGIGVNTSFFPYNKFLFRTSVQLGYTLPINALEQVNGFVLEFKVGLAINTAKFRKPKSKVID